MEYQVLLFYKYITIENPKDLAEQVCALMGKYNLKGRVIVAEEGINATMEGLFQDTENFTAEFLKDERFSDIDIKTSVGDGKSFPRISVKVRNEIVGTRFPKEKADPRVRTAPHLNVDQLREWYEKGKDFVVVDMRNSYEYISGHFKNSVDPGMKASRELPETIKKLEPLKEKTVLTVCTGGVRCEKMSAYLLSEGFKEVYQLENGIHSYMEKYPGKDFLGTLYTFDDRKVMDFGGEREIIGTCKLCGEKTERYVNCANTKCNLHFLACTNCAENDREVCCEKDCENKILEKIA